MASFFEVADTDVGSTAVVGCENNHRGFRHTAFFQRIEHPPHDGVGLHDEVGKEIEAAFAFPLVIDREGRVG